MFDDNEKNLTVPESVPVEQQRPYVVPTDPVEVYPDPPASTEAQHDTELEASQQETRDFQAQQEAEERDRAIEQEKHDNDAKWEQERIAAENREEVIKATDAAGGEQQATEAASHIDAPQKSEDPVESLRIARENCPHRGNHDRYAGEGRLCSCEAEYPEDVVREARKPRPPHGSESYAEMQDRVERERKERPVEFGG